MNSELRFCFGDFQSLMAGPDLAFNGDFSAMNLLRRSIIWSI